MSKYVILVIISLFLFSCDTKNFNDGANKEAVFSHSFNVHVDELTDNDYPDNPDIGFRHSSYGEFSHDSIVVSQVGEQSFNLTLLPGNGLSDTIFFTDVNLFAFMPVIPQHIHKDEYLKLIGIINQEWNRHQVRFDRAKNKFRFSNPNSFESKNVRRIDIARNCLNSGLWEIIAYAKDKDGSVQPYYHGWFDFPLDVYGVMFNEVNSGLDFKDYTDYLVKWNDPLKQKLDLSLLREVEEKEIECTIDVLNKGYYSETGARKKKKKNIIFPKVINSIQDFLNDSTTYSTFSPPGCYNTKDPRHTSLGLIYQMTGGVVRNITSNYVDEKDLKEIELYFNNKSGDKKTTIVFGGLDFDKFPVLPDSLHNNGYKYPMGIANHSFYETYQVAVNNNPEDNPYYGLIIDDEGKWLDSHFFGIDGPLFFWDKKFKKKLHLYLLSFERHSYVGHFTIDFNHEKE